jgi:alkylation response protein AidB-like acyl-CoA dehydrogenase
MTINHGDEAVSQTAAYLYTPRCSRFPSRNALQLDLAVGMLGPGGVPGSDLDALEWRTLSLTAPSISIRGGTDEIQRNIIGEHVLGLPPVPRVDTDRPWNEVPR